MKKLFALYLAVAVLAVWGCQEQQQQWGKGELPTAWQGTFGKDNQSRYLFAQERKLVGFATAVQRRLGDLEARPVYDPNDHQCDDHTHSDKDIDYSD